MNEITLPELDVDTYLLQLKRYDSLNNSTIYDYYPSQGDGTAVQYLEESVVEPFVNATDAKSSILYFVYQPLDSGKTIFFAKNQNFPIEPFASKYGYDLVTPTSIGEARIDYTELANRSVEQQRFESFILSGIEDFTPPTQRKQIVYDFKFISKGEIDNIGVQISVPDSDTTTATPSAASPTPTFSERQLAGQTVIRAPASSGGSGGGSSDGY
jgi:hypothetical protein